MHSGAQSPSGKCQCDSAAPNSQQDCDDQLRNAVQDGRWQDVQNWIQRDVSSTCLVWAVQQVTQHADDCGVLPILSHCPQEHISSVFTTLVRRGLWRAVCKLLERGVSQQQRQWAVEQAGERADTASIHLLLPYCPSHLLDTLLVQVVTRDLWPAVVLLLPCHISQSVRSWAVQEACDHADRHHVTHGILAHCDGHQQLLDCVVTRLVRRSATCDGQLWAATEACKRASDDRLLSIGRNYGIDQLEAALRETVTRGLWKTLCELLRHAYIHGIDDTLRWAVEEASLRADDDQLRDIISSCPDHLHKTLTNNIMTNAVRRRLWKSTGKLMRLCKPDANTREINEWAVDEACTHASDEYLSKLVREFSDDQCNNFLTEAAKRGMWKTVSQLLERIGRSNKSVSGAHEWAVEEACIHADDDQLSDIVEYCSQDKMKTLLVEAVRRVMWKTVGTLLSRSPGSHTAGIKDTRRWAVAEAVRHANDDQLESIVRHSHQDLPDTALTEAVTRGLWKTTRQLLRLSINFPTQDIRDTHRSWAVNEACKHADDDVLSDIVVYCSDDHFQTFFTNAVNRGQWKTVSACLRRIQDTGRGDIKETQRWAVEEACKYADDDQLSNMVIFCLGEPFESAMTSAVRRGLWKTVGVLLGTHYSNAMETQRWAVEEACKDASDDHLSAIVQKCPVDLLKPALLEVVKRGMWTTVGEVLERHQVTTWSDVTETLRCAVEEACQSDDDDQFSFLLTHCQSDNAVLNNTIVREAVRRGLWSAVCNFYWSNFDIHISTDTWRRVVENGFSHVGDVQLLWIGLRCFGAKLDNVLEVAVKRGLWTTVAHLVQNKTTTDKQTRWAVGEACAHADDENLSYIVQHCHDDQLEDALKTAVGRGLWGTVNILLERKGLDNKQKQWAIEAAYERANDVLRKMEDECNDDQLKAVVNTALDRGLWKTVCVLFTLARNRGDNCISDSTYTRIVQKFVQRRSDGEILFSFLHPDVVISSLTQLLQRGETATVCAALKEDFQHLLYKSLQPKEMWSRWKSLFVSSLSTSTTQFVAEPDPQKLLDLVTMFNDATIRSLISHLEEWAKYGEAWHLELTSRQGELWSTLASVLEDRPQKEREMCQHFFMWCFQRRGKDASLTQISFPLIATQSQNPKLRILAERGMWEETRRWYLQLLVEEKLWEQVKELADHSLYDDQRQWALDQARCDKRWDVVLVLADHGLTDDKMMRVHRQVARHADWDTVFQLFERAVDMRRVYEELLAANPSRDRPPDKQIIEKCRIRGENIEKLEAEYTQKLQRVAAVEAQHEKRCRELDQHGKFVSRGSSDLQKLLRGKQWYKALCNLRCHITTQRLDLVLQHAMDSDAGHVVMQLVRLGMDATQRDSLFSEAVKRQQWGVARVLLERGVSMELSRVALPELIEACQWILVSRVMELSLDDKDRLRVMQVALNEKEGSVVAHGISVMEGRLSVEEREAMFEQALNEGVWQAVKRLVEEKDSTGIAHRDKALQGAVQHHRWDIVDHCVRHGADLDERHAGGDTLLQEKTKRRDWDSVEGLLIHGADPNCTDREGYSAFQTVVKDTDDVPLKTLKVFTEYHGNINHTSPDGNAPLYHLIKHSKYRYGKTSQIIDCAILWGGNVGYRGDYYEGNTALHAVCEAGLWDSMRYIVARGVDPLAVTDNGRTVLTTCLQYKMWEWQDYERPTAECRQKLVAECIKLGVSTHQPRVTDRAYNPSRSPVYISISVQDIVVLHMLYESGACSHTELHKVYTQLLPNFGKENSLRYMQCWSYLEHIATNPRSLKSLCRLVISHHLGVRWQRKKLDVPEPRVHIEHIPDSMGERDDRQTRVKQLPVLDDDTKDYVVFADLVHPDYGKILLEGQQKESEEL